MFKAINGWTKSKILKVVRARRYNCAAVNSAGTCVYTTPNGNKCAVGLFIPKGHEGSKLSANSDELLSQYPDLEKKLPLTPRALKILQGVHDDCGPSGANSGANAKQAIVDWVKRNVK